MSTAALCSRTYLRRMYVLKERKLFQSIMCTSLPRQHGPQNFDAETLSNICCCIEYYPSFWKEFRFEGLNRDWTINKHLPTFFTRGIHTGVMNANIFFRQMTRKYNQYV